MFKSLPSRCWAPTNRSQRITRRKFLSDTGRNTVYSWRIKLKTACTIRRHVELFVGISSLFFLAQLDTLVEEIGTKAFDCLYRLKIVTCDIRQQIKFTFYLANIYDSASWKIFLFSSSTTQWRVRSTFIEIQGMCRVQRVYNFYLQANYIRELYNMNKWHFANTISFCVSCTCLKCVKNHKVYNKLLNRKLLYFEEEQRWFCNINTNYQQRNINIVIFSTQQCQYNIVYSVYVT